MAKIDILMATYNGELYIKEQIDSIINQSYTNWQLIIRDDNSIDNTLQIIAQYNDNRIKIVNDDAICGSAQTNFMQLLNYSNGDFVCFCDQDDIWINDKLQVMLDFIATKDNSQAQLIFSNGYLYYGEKRDDLPHLLNARPKNLKEQLFCNGGIHGSMAMFNAKMRKLMLEPVDFIAMHDHLLTLLGCAFNAIDYLEKPTFYYRQHLNNVTPHIAPNIAKRIAIALTKNRNLPVVDKTHFKGVAAFLGAHKNNLTAQNVKLCEAYLSYPNKNCLPRFVSILKCGFSLNNSKINLIAKLITRKYSNI